ncbi:hypothetical protein D3C85_1162710 [compost metagenome]
MQKQDGDKVAGLKASVQSPLIHLDNPAVVVEIGDLIERRMSNGAIETYEVLDPDFYEAFHGFPPHYKLRVRKLGVPEAKARVQSITYNISGHNARVNHDSVDAQRKDASEIVDAVAANLASQKPSKTVVSALLSALPHLASISTITSSILAAL